MILATPKAKPGSSEKLNEILIKLERKIRRVFSGKIKPPRRMGSEMHQVVIVRPHSPSRALLSDMREKVLAFDKALDVSTLTDGILIRVMANQILNPEKFLQKAKKVTGMARRITVSNHREVLFEVRAFLAYAGCVSGRDHGNVKVSQNKTMAQIPIADEKKKKFIISVFKKYDLESHISSRHSPTGVSVILHGFKNPIKDADAIYQCIKPGTKFYPNRTLKKKETEEN